MENVQVLLPIMLFLTTVYVLFFRRRKKEFMLSLISICITLGFVEIALRLFSPQINEHSKMFTQDASLGWKFIPNKTSKIIFHEEVHHEIQTNSNGFRDHSLPLKNDSAKKILFIGDSFVSNISVASNEVFTEIIQSNLRNTQAINFGVNGYGQVQEYLQLTEWYDSIQPDLVIVMIYIRNDFKDNIDIDWLYPRPYASFDESTQSLKIHPITENNEKVHTSVNMREKSHLYHLIRRKTKAVKSKYTTTNSYQIDIDNYTPPELYLCLENPSESTNQMFHVMEELLLKFTTYANEKNVPIVFTLAPSIFQVEDELWTYLIDNYGTKSANYLSDLPNKRLMQFAKTNQLEMIDLLPNLRKESKLGKRLYYPQEQHWTKEGNSIVAQTLLHYLKHGSDDVFMRN